MKAYERVSAELQRWIREGQVKQGELLPAEAELCRSFGVSRITVRHAVRLLSEQGLVKPRAGQGTRVCSGRNRMVTLQPGHFVDSMSALIPPVQRALLKRDTLRPPAGIARQLDLPAEAICLYAERVDTWIDEPMAFDRVYIPDWLTAGISDAMLQDLDFLKQWARTIGRPLSQTRRAIRSVAANTRISRLLKISRGKPLLVQEDLMFLSDGRPAALFISFYRGDRYQIVSTEPGP